MTSPHTTQSTGNHINVGNTERIASMAWGALLFASGFSHLRNFSATVKTLLGGYLLYRGISGYCKVNTLLDRNSERSIPDPLVDDETIVILTQEV